LSEENKVNWNEILQDVDIAEFCEKYLGVELFEYQKVMLRNLYKEYEKKRECALSKGISIFDMPFLLYII